jgi:hypothetical protein
MNGFMLVPAGLQPWVSCGRIKVNAAAWQQHVFNSLFRARLSIRRIAARCTDRSDCHARQTSRLIVEIETPAASGGKASRGRVGEIVKRVRSAGALTL